MRKLFYFLLVATALLMINSLNTAKAIDSDAALLPDFVVTKAELVQQMGSNVLVITIKNQGAQAAGNNADGSIRQLGVVAEPLSGFANTSAKFGALEYGNYDQNGEYQAYMRNMPNATAKTASVRIRLDANNYFAETNDKNNVSEHTILVSSAGTTSQRGPDFVISNIALRYEVLGELKGLFAHVVIENRGNTASGTEYNGAGGYYPKPLAIELSTGDGINANYFTEMMQETSYPRGFKKTFRIGPFHNASAANYTVRAAVDKYNGYVESNEANNSYEKMLTTPRPDFVVRGIRLQQAENNAYYAIATIYNQGNSYNAVSKSELGVESAIPVALKLLDIKRNKTYYATATESSYLAKSTKDIRFGPIEGLALRGYLTARVWVDINNSITENSEGNNQTTRTMKALLPDFIVSSVRVIRDTSSSTAPVYKAKIMIKNNGVDAGKNVAADKNNLYITVLNLKAHGAKPQGFNLKAENYAYGYEEAIWIDLGPNYKLSEFLITIDPGNAYAETNDANNYKRLKSGMVYSYSQPTITN